MFSEYESKAIKPNDFEQFYENLLSKTCFENLEIIECKEFSIENISMNNLFFTTDDGARVHAKYTYPKAGKIKKVILSFHGYYGNSGSWFEKIAYAKLGYAVLALDVRGQSGLSTDVCQTTGSTLKGMVIKGLVDGPENMYYTQIYMDTYRLANIAKKLHPKTKIVAVGASQGGALAAVCSALCPEISQCIINYPYLSDIEHAYDLGMPYDGIESYFKLEDPLAETYDMFFNRLRYIDIQFFANKIKADTFMFVGMKDIVCPPECQSAFFNKLNCRKKTYFYREKGHEYLDGAEDITLKIIMDQIKLN